MLAPDFLPSWGGAGTYTVELVKHLPKSIGVHVVTPMRERLGKSRVPTSKYGLSQFIGSNVRIHYLSRASDTFTYNAKFQYDCLRFVPKLLKEERIDIVHSQSQMPDLLLGLRRLSTPTIVTLHNTMRSQRGAITASGVGFSSLDRAEKGVSLLYPVLSLLEELYYRRTQRYIAPSNWMRGEVMRYFRMPKEREEGIHVIPNSVEVDECRSIAETGRNRLSESFRSSKVVLYCGRLLASKGAHLLVESIPRVLKEVDDEALFVFAGPGNPISYVEKLKRLKVPLRNYLFTGPISRVQSLQMMGCAELCIVPSFSENCPYVVIEAMACEVPVVASNVGGIPEMIHNGDNGLTFRPGSSDDLSENVIILLGDRNLQRKISQRAQEVVSRKFSWSANLKKQLEAYQVALS